MLSPIRPIQHGSFNSRPINKKSLDQLVHIMQISGVHSNLYSTAIPILANPDHIHSSSIFTDITKLTQAPELKLSAKGETEVKKFYSAGGNHRTAAVGVLNSLLEQSLEKLEAEIAKLEQKNSTKSKAKARLDVLRSEVAKLKVKQSGLGKWTILLYDDGE